MDIKSMMINGVVASAVTGIIVASYFWITAYFSLPVPSINWGVVIIMWSVLFGILTGINAIPSKYFD